MNGPARPDGSAGTATPFRKVLVANRGEVALRVMRTARRLGYRTVAVHSTADAGAPHVEAADQAVCIGEARPAESYLNIEAILAAARLSGADAVHPGYGFLAENDAFAAACRAAGLVFIGPSPEAIAAMGNKAVAKDLMQRAGVPCIPGYQGEDQGDDRLLAEAGRLGYPVMIKATAGGGGRGMRLVTSAADFPRLLHSARSEAQGAFGDPGILLERAIVEPRHVEIQVFADRHGHVVHLGERDCSVQRRHQKLVEEAPSPAVGEDLRERMGATAATAARAIGYEGAGTFEFLVDAGGAYYFMEANTRLQVEHPVTEEVYGVDLVEWQLRVAAGEPLPLAQEDLRPRGHAIEVRLCAEDADADFLPQAGTLVAWRAPEGVRVEHALRPGAAVSPHYDSMIAKLVCHGATREEARRKLVLGLEHLVALGVTTNQHFLARCLEHPVFAAGRATTAFVGAHLAELRAVDPATRERALSIAAVLLLETLADGSAARTGQALGHALPIALRLDSGGESRTVTLARLGAARFVAEADGPPHPVSLLGLSGGTARVACDGLAEAVDFVRDGAHLRLRYRGTVLDVHDRSRAHLSPGGPAAASGSVRASMGGRVVAVLAAAGERVAAGQPLVTLEAMKMEHVHLAPGDGVVAALAVAVGDTVAAGTIVAEIALAAAPGTA